MEETLCTPFRDFLKKPGDSFEGFSSQESSEEADFVVLFWKVKDGGWWGNDSKKETFFNNLRS